MRRWSSLAFTLSFPVLAQTTVEIPALFVIPNEDRIPVGQIEGIEGGSFSARAKGVGAVYYNPAGLALSKSTEISAASSAYEWTSYQADIGQVGDAGSRLSSNGRMYGLVLGEPLTSSDRWRFGLAVPAPVSFKPTLQMGNDQGAYATSGSYGDIIPTLAVGYAARPDFRLGGSLGVSFLTLSQGQTLTVQTLGGGNSELSTNTVRVDGTAYSLLLTGGLQWDVSPKVTLGLVVGAPGVRLGGSSNVLVDQTVSRNDGYQALQFLDPAAKFNVRHPAWVRVGAAVRFEGGELEVDLKHTAAAASYEVFTSEVEGTATDAATGGSTQTQVPFQAPRDQRRAVTNISLGGRYALTARTTLHGGLFTSRSPETPGSIYQQVDIYGVSTGFSVKWAHISGSLGFVYEWGGRDLAVPLLLNGVQANSALGISSVHCLWGLTYQF